MPAPPPVVPQQFGRYRIVGKIGEGGMGTVYRAVDSELQRDIALKVPHFGPDEDPSIIERFYREARLAGRIAHPNVCPVYDVGAVNGIHYLTMPFIDGVALGRRISSEQPWPPERAAELMAQIARAVHVMHLHGIIHRDLKPSNILLRYETEPVLMDFGLARPYRADGPALTVTGAIMGTPAYMSPEQVGGAADELGPATDVYSLGVMLYELLTGKRPFSGPPAVMYAQILRVAPPPPSGLRPGLDPRLDSICLKTMAKRPSDRYRSAEDLASALNAFLGHEEAPLPSPQLIVEPTEPRVTCPTCGRTLRVPETLRGRRLKCPGCRTRLVTDPPTPSPEPIAPDMAPTRPPSAGATIGPDRGPQKSPRRFIVPILSLLFLVGVVVTLLVLSRTGKAGLYIESVEQVRLQPGQNAQARLKLSSTPSTGPIEVVVEDLPAGITCKPVTAAAGENTVVLTVRAGPRAPVGQHRAHVKASAGTAQVSATLVITVAASPR